MARAEITAVDSMIALKELCDHDFCSCKGRLGSDVPDLLQIGQAVVTDRRIETPLNFLFQDGGEHSRIVPGVVSRTEVIEAFIGCDGVCITDEGLVCGALDTLRRKSRNGRSKVRP